MRKVLIGFFGCILFLLFSISVGVAEEEKKEEKKNGEAYKLEEITVTAPLEKKDVVVAPGLTTIKVEDYETSGVPLNIVDVLEDRAIIDFRGYSDLVRGNDDIYMRGFGSRNFIIAVDGLSVGRTEGQGGNFVDFSTIPLTQVESIEILPGPHSVLYSGRGIGGVINVKMKPPKKYKTLKPDFKAMTSYSSYDTWTNRLNINGGINSFIYGLSYEKYHTDGYLRHNEADTETFSGSFSYILPSDGYLNFAVSYWDAKRESPEKNDPGRKDYDPSYPVSESGSNPGTAVRRDDRSYSYSLHFEQPTYFGKWTVGASHTHAGRVSYYDDGTVVTGKPSPKKWNTFAANIQNEFRIFNNHLVTVGGDFQKQLASEWQPENQSYAAFIQDKWKIIPRLTLTGGLRYEYFNIWWANKEGSLSYDPSAGSHIKTDYHQVLPKLFLTYELDDLSRLLRDTSLSFAVSRIWSPTSYCPH